MRTQVSRSKLWLHYSSALSTVWPRAHDTRLELTCGDLTSWMLVLDIQGSSTLLAQRVGSGTALGPDCVLGRRPAGGVCNRGTVSCRQLRVGAYRAEPTLEKRMREMRPPRRCVQKTRVWDARGESTGGESRFSRSSPTSSFCNPSVIRPRSPLPMLGITEAAILQHPWLCLLVRLLLVHQVASARGDRRI